MFDTECGLNQIGQMGNVHKFRSDMNIRKLTWSEHTTFSASASRSGLRQIYFEEMLI